MQTKILIAVALLLAPACERDSMNLDQGRARIEQVVDATVETILNDDVETTSKNTEPGLCDSDDEGHVGYEVSFPVKDLDIDALFEETEGYWKERGFSTNMRNPGSVLPALFAEDEGFSFSLQINPKAQIAWIGGGTPCLKKE